MQFVKENIWLKGDLVIARDRVAFNDHWAFD